MQRIIIICGPTAVGKTRVAIELAQQFNGEIVSADSQQVWRGFDIGTAKPSESERAEVKHHLIDVADPIEHFDAAKFVELADRAIADIISRGRMPFVVGGTGMYLRMLVHGLCKVPPRDPDIRARLEREIVECGIEKLHTRLAEIDPASAAKIKSCDTTRIIRALEIYELTGMPASKIRKHHNFTENRYEAIKIGLNMDRVALYERIEKRVDQMIKNGLVDETCNLREKYGDEIQPFAAVGYKEIAAHLRGEISVDEAVRLIKQNTRRFAKRQLTWFRADSDIHWFSLNDGTGAISKIVGIRLR